MLRTEIRPIIRRLRIAAVSVSIALVGAAGPAPTLAEAQPVRSEIQLQAYNGFNDVGPGEWYVTGGFLDYVVDNRLLVGYDGETFGPHDEIKRGQIAVILHRMAGEPDADSAEFDDVDYGQYYGPAIRWARATGVVNGDAGTNNFGPDRNVTRQEFAQMLANYAENIGGLDVSSDGAGLDVINGAGDVSDWARPAMGWAVDNGLISGVVHADGTSWVEPHGATLRCQAAKMITVLHRDVLGLGPDKPDDPDNPNAPDYPDEDYNGPTEVEFTEEVAGSIPDSSIARQDGNSVEIVTAADQYKVGDIVTLSPSENFPFGTAVRIESAKKTNGLTKLRGTIPHPDEVYESLAINERFGMDDVLDSSVGLQAIGVSDNSFTVSENFREYGSVSGTITLNDFDGHVIYIAPPSVLSVLIGYTDIDFSADLTADLDFELSALPEDARKIKVGKPIPLPVVGAPGVGFNVQFYLEVDVTGHVVASADIQVETNIHRDFIGLHEMTGDSSVNAGNSLSVAVNGSVGVNASLGLYLILPDPLVDGGISAGLEAEVKLTQHPGLICGDAALWFYTEGQAHFILEPNSDLSITVFDRDNSPFEVGIHVEDGELVPECTWGEETEPDDPDDPAHPTNPQPVLKGVSRVDLGRQYSAAYDIDGELWMWGKNNNYQLGDNIGENAPSPKLIMDEVRTVSLGYEHTVAVDTNGTLWAWGNNNAGECGIDPAQGAYRLLTPTKIMDGVVDVNASDYNTGVLKEDGSLWIWGYNASGILGNGSFTDSYQPAFEPANKVFDEITSFDMGGNTCAAIDVYGNLWTWGSDAFGLLGDGGEENRDSAVPVKIMEGVRSVSVSFDHVAAIKTDGTLWAWGDNSYGQLGDGTRTGSTTPKLVMSNIEAISCGSYFTAAIDGDGAMWTWGDNTYGQLGDGSTASRSTPASVMEDIISVSAGENHLAAVDEDGNVYTWGDNYYGQLGNGKIG